MLNKERGAGRFVASRKTMMKKLASENVKWNNDSKCTGAKTRYSVLLWELTQFYTHCLSFHHPFPFHCQIRNSHPPLSFFSFLFSLSQILILSLYFLFFTCLIFCYFILLILSVVLLLLCTSHLFFLCFLLFIFLCCS